MCLFFFFQAEDGIRDIGVTGVQTCALPISALRAHGGDPAGAGAGPRDPRRDRGGRGGQAGGRGASDPVEPLRAWPLRHVRLRRLPRRGARGPRVLRGRHGGCVGAAAGRAGDRVSQRATGIGGVFFRARDPDALREWYAEHLGVTFEPLWEQEAGPTVWAPFKADTDYFGRPEQAWMINFRVDDLDAMVDQLSAAG